MTARGAGRTRAPWWAACALFLALASGPPSPWGPAPLPAQDAQVTTLAVEPGTGALRMEVGNLLEEGGLTRALHSGLPLRILVEVELWSDGFFDSQKGEGAWRASVVYDPLARRYRVGVEGGGEVVVDSLPAVTRTLQRAFQLSLRPREEGRYYYLGEIRVETLSLSDLEELQQWLRGDLAPAVSGERRVEDAVGSGVRRMLVRMLGLPARRVQVRSPTFEVGPGPLPREDLPPDRQGVDPLQVRLDADPRPVRDAHAPVLHLELRLHDVPLPVATAGGDVPREGESR